MLAQHRVERQLNEITAIQELLNLLDIKSTIITLDTMGSQRDIVSHIIAQGGDYTLALKGNQGHLHKGVKAFFKAAENTEWAGIEYRYSKGTESGHHRLEHRQVWAIPISQLSDLPNRIKWQGLTSVVIVKRERKLWNKTTEEVCFYITRLAANAVMLAQATRSHWGIENSLHWYWMSLSKKAKAGFAGGIALRIWGCYGVCY